MSATLQYTGTLVVTTCWCGVRHGVPSELYRQAERHGMTVYCPLGHKWVVSDTDDKKIERLERRVAATRDLLHAEERSHAATRGHLTRTKNRIAKGVCPCCNRHFANVERHMQSQHPHYEGAQS